MTRLLTLSLALTVSSLLGACAPSLKSYADPSYRNGTTAQLLAIDPPLPVRVDVQFQQRGEHKPNSDIRLRGHVERALLASRMLVPDQLSTRVLRVLVKNVGDASEARAAGIKNGLSFGLAGSVVTDEYQFNISYTDGEGKKSDVFFRHAIHTAVGQADLPTGTKPLKPQEAYGETVQDAVTGALLQWQGEGVLASASAGATP